MSGKLQRVVGFRNVLVHGYDGVVMAKVRSALEDDLVHFPGFVDGIRGRLRGA